jgi:hypothetical protein
MRIVAPQSPGTIGRAVARSAPWWSGCAPATLGRGPYRSSVAVVWIVSHVKWCLQCWHRTHTPLRTAITYAEASYECVQACASSILTTGGPTGCAVRTLYRPSDRRHFWILRSSRSFSISSMDFPSVQVPLPLAHDTPEGHPARPGRAGASLGLARLSCLRAHPRQHRLRHEPVEYRRKAAVASPAARLRDLPPRPRTRPLRPGEQALTSPRPGLLQSPRQRLHAPPVAARTAAAPLHAPQGRAERPALHHPLFANRRVLSPCSHRRGGPGAWPRSNIQRTLLPTVGAFRTPTACLGGPLLPSAWRSAGISPLSLLVRAAGAGVCSLGPPGCPAVPRDFLQTCDLDPMPTSRRTTPPCRGVDAGWRPHTPPRLEDGTVTCPLVPGGPTPRLRFLGVAPPRWMGRPADPTAR